jgi:hypothetical protein
VFIGKEGYYVSPDSVPTASMEVRGPNGELRWLKHPWRVLAFQIAGGDGLRTIHPKSLSWRDATIA